MFQLHLKPNAELLGGRSVALCNFCYRVLPSCIVEHLRCTLVSSKIARSQEDALKGSTLEYLVPLISAGRAVPMPQAGGQFVVGDKFVLAPSSPQPFMEIGYPHLMATGLPIVRFSALAEE